MGTVHEQMFGLIEILRVRGLSFPDIRNDRALTSKFSQEDIRATVEYYKAEIEDPIALDLQRLDRLIAQLDKKASEGNVAAMRSMVAVLDRRAKLLGLDSPVKLRTEVRGQVSYTVNGVSPADLT